MSAEANIIWSFVVLIVAVPLVLIVCEVRRQRAEDVTMR